MIQGTVTGEHKRNPPGDAKDFSSYSNLSSKICALSLPSRGNLFDLKLFLSSSFFISLNRDLKADLFIPRKEIRIVIISFIRCWIPFYLTI